MNTAERNWNVSVGMEGIKCVDHVQTQVFVEKPRIYVMSPTSAIEDMIHRIETCTRLLQKSTGYYRPSFPRFYNFFYWQSPDPSEEIVLTMKALAVQFLVAISPLERILLSKLGRILEWKEDNLNRWLKQSYHPLIQAQSTEVIVKSFESSSVVSSNVIQFLFLDDIYPSLQIRGTKLQIQSSSSSTDIRGNVESIRGCPKQKKLQLVSDLFPKCSVKLTQSQPKQPITAQFQIEVVNVSIYNPIISPIRIRSSHSVIHYTTTTSSSSSPSSSSSSSLTISFDRIGVSVQQESTLLFLAYLQHGKVTYANSNLLVSPSLTVKINILPSIYSYLNPIPYYPSVPFHLDFLIQFASLDFTLQSNPLIIQLIASEGAIESNKIYSLKQLQLNVSYPNNKPRTLALVKRVHGVSSIFEIDKIQAGISAGLVQSLIDLQSDLQPWIVHFITKPRINRLLNPSEQPSQPLDSFLIHVKIVNVMYVSLHPDPQLVHQIGLICQISDFSLSSTTLSWHNCDISVKSSKSPFSMDTFSNLNSACILSIPSPSVEYMRSYLSLRIPQIESTISLSEMSMILGLLNEMSTPNRGHFIAIPRKVGKEQLLDTRNQWLQRKWNQQYKDADELLEVLNAMCKSLELQQMKLPEKVNMNIESIDIQLNVENDVISKLNFTQLECELLVENNSLIHSTFLIDSTNLYFNHPTLDRPLKVKRFFLPNEETNHSKSESNSTVPELPTQGSEPLSPFLHVTLNIELSQLPRVSSVVVSISPLQLHFSIPALKSIASFFEDASISKHPKPSYFSQAINLRYLRVNAIHVYCELFSSTVDVNYALIPFRLHPVTLHDRICSIKQIFSSLRMHLIADLLSQATQHVSQASAVMANAMGFSGIVSLLRRPVPVPSLVNAKRRKKQRSRKIRLLLGKHVHDSPIPSHSESTPICTEVQQETFVNNRFEELQSMLLSVYLIKFLNV